MNTHRSRARTAFGLPLLAVSLVAAAGCANAPNDRGVGVGQEPRITLTLANGNSEHQELQPFADAVARLSDDTVHVDFRDSVHAGEPEAPAAIVNDVKAGKFDLGWTSAANWHQLGVTSFDALVAPFLIDSYDLEEKVLASAVATKMLGGLDSMGLAGVGIQPGPLKLLSASKHPLVRPDDFVGATVAIGPSTITVDTLKALGATTMTIASGGSIEGADAVEAQLGAIIGNHYESTMKHTGVNVVMFPRPVIYYANEARLHSLSNDQQEALHLAVQQASAAALGNLHQVEDAAFAALCANGSEMAVATDANLAALRAAVQPVYEQLRRDAATATDIASIEAMKAQLPVRAPAHGCPVASATPTGTAAPSSAPGGFPDGKYEATISVVQMEASTKQFAIPPDAQMQCPCKAGFTLKDGVMTGGENDRWYYSFFGDHLTIGVQGSANAAFTVRWTFDGHQVTFTDMVGGDAGDRGVFESAPFAKVN